MSQITTNMSDLTVDQKIVRGGNIVLKSTNNPLVPGNGPTLTAFSTEQDAFVAANLAVVGAREDLRQKLAARDEVEARWTAACNTLADFTQIATGGNEASILTTGFGVRAPRTPPQPMTAPVDLRVATNGAPGNSKLRWTPVDGAVTYIVECSVDPEAGFSPVLTTTKSNIEIGGATPGKVCWFRVAAVGPSGQGPWCTPVQRPVM